MLGQQVANSRGGVGQLRARRFGGVACAVNGEGEGGEIRWHLELCLTADSHDRSGHAVSLRLARAASDREEHKYDHEDRHHKDD
jgi:hypothetical protein